MGHAADKLGRLWFLRPGELGRVGPFFGLYLLLFAAFSLADGLSVALFVKRVGADALPLSYAFTAAANLVFILGYVFLAERIGGARTFAVILGIAAGVYGATWIAVRF